MAIVAIRGAVSVPEDTPDQVKSRSALLLQEILKRNSLVSDDVVSIFFTATSDIRSVAPAVGVRELDLGDVPLLCAQEMFVEGSMERVIRCFVHVESSHAPQHVFLGSATKLRPDLAQAGDNEL